MSSILDAREKLAAILAPVDPGDPPVVSAPVDAVAPPMLAIGWAAPMIDTWAACTAFGNLFVMVFAARLDIAAGYEVIEAQYQRVQTLLRQNAWSITNDTGPGAVMIAKTLYLGCRIDVRAPLSL